MKLWKNREVRLLCTADVLFILSGIICAALFPAFAITAVLASGICCLAAALIFLKRYYRMLSGLSDYLYRVSSGVPAMDIRDNREGELSVLKNEIYKVTSRLQETAQVRQEQSRYLADSLSNISHQIKTPMTSMLVMTDLLGDENLPPEKQEAFIISLREQLKRLDWLVASLLKLSKLDADSIKFKEEPVNLPALIEKASSHLLIPMELKEQTFLCEGSQDVYFIGDLNWSAEAVANILKNCMEHTPPGGRITVSWEANPLYTQIIVSDTGTGISQDDLPYIFDRFYTGISGSKDSVGIGLAMAKEIFLKQKGTIEVESALGKGTQFIIKVYNSAI